MYYDIVQYLENTVLKCISGNYFCTNEAWTGYTLLNNEYGKTKILLQR